MVIQLLLRIGDVFEVFAVTLKKGRWSWNRCSLASSTQHVDRHASAEGRARASRRRHGQLSLCLIQPRNVYQISASTSSITSAVQRDHVGCLAAAVRPDLVLSPISRLCESSPRSQSCNSHTTVLRLSS